MFQKVSIDTLQKYSQDSIRLVTLDKKIKRIARAKQYDSAIFHTYRILKLSERLSDSTAIAKSHYRLAYYNLQMHKLKEAYLHYNNAYKCFAQMGDSLAASARLCSMARIQKRLGDFSGSRLTALDALRYVENTSHYEEICNVYEMIAVSHSEQKNYNEALKWISRVRVIIANSIFSKKINVKEIPSYNNTVGLILTNLGRYNESIAIFEALLKDSIVLNNEGSYAMILSNLGLTKWKADPENQESEKMLLEGLAGRQKVNSVSGQIAANVFLTKYYYKKNKKKALHYALDALENSEKLKNPAAIMETLDLIIPLKKELGLSLKEEALLYSTSSNSLDEVKQKVRRIYATNKYDHDKLTKDNLILKAETAKEEAQKTFYLAALIIAILCIGYVVYYKNQQKKREKLEETHKAEMRFSRKIHDELGNDIFYLMTQIQNKNTPLKDMEAVNVLEGLNSVYNKARDISKEYTSIDTGNKYGTELIALLNSYGNEKIKIITTQLAVNFWDKVSGENKINLYRILQELLTNMTKHSEASLVGVTFSKEKRKIIVKYVDNGIGIDPSTFNFGNGLQNVENRLHSMNGSINFESKPKRGLTVMLMFTI